MFEGIRANGPLFNKLKDPRLFGQQLMLLAGFRGKRASRYPFLALESFVDGESEFFNRLYKSNNRAPFIQIASGHLVSSSRVAAEVLNYV
jgi:hypothetical protein